MKLSRVRKKKRSKIIQVKAINKGVRKTVVRVFFNLSKYVILCVKKM